MRFRRRSGFRRKGTREQLLWLRPAFTKATVTTGAPAAVVGTVFQGSAVDSGFDQRLTMRRLHLGVFLNADPRDQDLFLRVAVYKAYSGAPGSTPNMNTADDRQTDWLAFKDFYVGGAAANSSAIIQNTSWELDVRTNRKVDERETITVSALIFRASLAALTAGNTVDVTIAPNILFQRTRR